MRLDYQISEPEFGAAMGQSRGWTVLDIFRTLITGMTVGPDSTSTGPDFTDNYAVP
jgi:hypothetical protein